MIVEMRTYSFVPGKTPEALERIARGLAQRTRLSPLGALWQTETGRLHQIIHLWPFDSFAHRESVRGRFTELEHWPAQTGEFTEQSETKIMRPAPFSPPLRPQKLGPVYEICTDTYRSGALPGLLAQWQARIEERSQLSPLVGAWHTILGPMNQWIHVWAYESLENRREVRERAVQEGLWPPEADPAAFFVKQESAICFPASFSPLQ